MGAASQTEVLKGLNARLVAGGWTFTCHPAEGFVEPDLIAAHALWREKAGTRDMPARTDLTARAMKPFMTHMSLLERNGARYRVRLHGSSLARYSGDSTNKFLDEVVEPSRIGAYLAIYETVLAHRMPLRVVSQYQAPEIDYLTGESLVAPLSHPASETPLILSVTYAKARSFATGGLSLARLTTA